MANPTITDLPPVPNREDAPTTFVDKADAFLGALPGFQAEANALAAAVEADAVQVAADRVQTGLDRASAAASANIAVNAPGTNGTSATSLTVGVGTKTFTTQAGKVWSVGQGIVIASTASPLNQMTGVMTAYNSSTGAMTVEVTVVGGTGTFAAWTVSLAAGAPVAAASQAEAEAGTDSGKMMTPLRTAQAAVAKLATQAEAEAGTDAAKTMTPLRTAQAVAALGGSVGDIVFSTGAHDSRWLPADGGVVLKSSYPALAAVLGTTPNNLTNVWPSTTAGLGTSAIGNIAYGNGRWVVVNSSGAASVSTDDCVSWTPNPGPGPNYAGVSGAAPSPGGLMAYGAGLFVIFNPYTGNRATSPDGVNWTPSVGGLTVNIQGNGGNITGVLFENGMFIVWGQYGTPAIINVDGDNINSTAFIPFIYTSTDAISWTRSPVGGSWSLSSLYSQYANASYINTITYSNGVFLAVGNKPANTYNSAQYGVIQTSVDGVNWIERMNSVPHSSPYWCAGVSGGGVHLAVFMGYTYRSADGGVSWSQIQSLTYYSALIYVDGVFILENQSLQIMTSFDGLNWVQRGNVPWYSYNFGCISYKKNGGIICMSTTASGNIFYTNIFTYNTVTQFIKPGVQALAATNSRVPAVAYIRAR